MHRYFHLLANHYKPLLVFFCLLASYSLGAQAPSSASKIRLKGWEKEQLAPGLKWKHLYDDNLFDSPQNINVLEIDLRLRDVALVYEAKIRKPTSDFARKHQALAAVNAGFFDMRNGGSVTYLKADGVVVNKNRPNLEAKGSFALKGVFMIEKDEDVRIENTVDKPYLQDEEIRDALVTGPFLLDDGQAVPLDSISFNYNRHPRTCACLTKKGKLILLTVDGRHEQARGMTIPELTRLLKKLKCWDAINFDGGGSTSMYIQGQPANGIVNRPSDNKKFDPFGERKVANVLLVF